jgi:hypothetical protein
MSVVRVLFDVTNVTLDDRGSNEKTDVDIADPGSRQERRGRGGPVGTLNHSTKSGKADPSTTVQRAIHDGPAGQTGHAGPWPMGVTGTDTRVCMRA